MGAGGGGVGEDKQRHRERCGEGGIEGGRERKRFS